MVLYLIHVKVKKKPSAAADGLKF